MTLTNLPKNKKAILLKRPENEITDDLFEIMEDKKINLLIFSKDKINSQTKKSLINDSFFGITPVQFSLYNSNFFVCSY